MSTIKDGYKETEIGVIPEEWEVVKVGDILNVQTGKMNAQDQVENGKYPFFTRSVDVQTIDTFAYDTEALFIAGEGNFKVKYYNGKFNLHQRTYMLTSIKDANIKFLLNAIQPKVNKLISTSVGSTVQSLRKPLIEDLKIPFPPLKEQEKIADILSTADEKIDAITSQIQKAEILKKGLLQKLLSDGIGHSEFKDSELGKIPENWKVVELGSCVNGKGNYGIGAAAVNYDKNLPIYLRITDIDDNGNFISSNKKCVDSLDVSNYQLEDGDIVFARTGNTTGKTYLYNPDDGILIYAGFLIKFTPNKKVLNTYYLKLQASTERYWNWVKVTSMRTGQPGINSEEYSKFIFPLPPLEEQKQIADILSTADEKLEVLRAKKEKYEELKKGLLQKLLSGEVRV